MSQNYIDPDLNLQNFNDHGILTIEEIDELSAIVKQQYLVFHINTRSLNQHYKELCNLLNSEEAVPISQSDIPAQAGNMPQFADNLPTDIPLQNRFKVLREEPEPMGETVRDPVRMTTVIPDPTPQINKKASSVILCDSNGKYLRLNKLCPNRQVTYYRCPTITSGNEIISKLPPDSPEMILIHTGTNDLETTKTADLLASKISNLVNTTAKEFPSAKMIYSSLLPRRDVPFNEISKTNSLIEKVCSRITNVHLFEHSYLNISQQNILHDQKHLNQDGVKLFAKNLKDAIYDILKLLFQRKYDTHLPWTEEFI